MPPWKAILVVLSALAQAPAADLRFVEPSSETGTSMAVVVAGSVPLVHTAQFLPLNKEGKITRGESAQIAQVLENLAAALSGADSDFSRIIKINVCAASPQVVAEVKKEFAKRFRGQAKPSVSFVAGKLAHPDALVAMDAVAGSTLRTGTVKRLALASLPQIRSGSHVAVLPPGGKVYVAGQAEKGDLAQATRLTLESLRKTLNHLNLNDSHIVQLKSFVQPMSGIGEVHKEMEKFFGDQKVPPLVFVEWSSTLPIEIELIASSPANDKAEVIEYLTPPGMTASPIYSRVARINHGNVIYLSGLYGLKGGAGQAQIEEIFDSMKTVLQESGSDFKHLAKATYYVSTEEASRKLNELRPRYYDPKRPPAASKAMVAGTGIEGKSITLDMIALPKDKTKPD